TVPRGRGLKLRTIRAVAGDQQAHPLRRAPAAEDREGGEDVADALSAVEFTNIEQGDLIRRQPELGALPPADRDPIRPRAPEDIIDHGRGAEKAFGRNAKALEIGLAA